MSPLPLPTQTHLYTRRAIGTTLSQGLITIITVLFLATLLFFLLRRNARRSAEERKVLKLAHLRGLGTDPGGNEQVRGSEDTLVEGRGDGSRSGGGQVRMELGMVPMGLTGMRPVYAGDGEEAPPPAYEANMTGRTAAPVMPAAHMPDRR